jgi:hypothetical protein
LECFIGANCRAAFSALNQSHFLSFFRQISRLDCGIISPKGGDTMSKAYSILFNAITDCIRILVAAQRAAEEEAIK